MTRIAAETLTTYFSLLLLLLLLGFIIFIEDRNGFKILFIEVIILT